MMKFVNLICFSLFSKEIHYYILFIFVPHSFNCFLHVMPAPIYPQKLPPYSRSDPPCSGSILGMACSEHCGVLRTAWSNVDEAWGSQSGVNTLNSLSDVSLSAKRFSAFNL